MLFTFCVVRQGGQKNPFEQKQRENKLREQQDESHLHNKEVERAFSSSIVAHSSLQMVAHAAAAGRELIREATRRKTLGVPPHANAGDKEHCGRQRDCAPPWEGEGGGWRGVHLHLEHFTCNGGKSSERTSTGRLLCIMGTASPSHKFYSLSNFPVKAGGK